MCGLLSDADIAKMIKKGEIEITDFEEKCLTPVGYDLRVGEFGFSWKKRHFLNIGKEKEIVIDPGDTVLISTLEDVSISQAVAGTIHSKVSLVSYGFTHISTTVDPGWRGKMLIQISNSRRIPLTLKYGDPFCTLVFYKVLTPAKMPSVKPPERSDILKWITFMVEEEKKERSLKAIIRQILKRKVGSILVSVFLGYGIVLVIFSIFSYFFGWKIETSTIASIIIAGAALSAAIMSTR